ncbi:MAG TPA: BON domain-containing protein [Cyclobacteriaceae bacterium]|nr:BON domain-containing protein [Cyclobacteriaceae bacterium]
MRGNGFGEYDIDHEERDNRNSSLYGSSRTGAMHRGKGPKGYKRSDERIREDINDRLSDDDSLDASEIEVDVKNGEVILRGTVSERSDKRRAEDVAESVSGVSNVENRIRMESNASDSNSSGALGRETSSKTSKSNERSKLQEAVA